MLGQECGLDRERGIVFHIQPEVMGLVPRRVDCTAAVAEAMRFLTGEWLVDVQSDYAGKCVADRGGAEFLIERTLLRSVLSSLSLPGAAVAVRPH